jgi:hypothetical protein
MSLGKAPTLRAVKEKLLSGEQICGDLSFLDMVFGTEWSEDDHRVLSEAIVAALDSLSTPEAPPATCRELTELHTRLEAEILAIEREVFDREEKAGGETPMARQARSDVKRIRSVLFNNLSEDGTPEEHFIRTAFPEDTQSPKGTSDLDDFALLSEWQQRRAVEARQRGLDSNGVNQHGVTMCGCKPYGGIHVHEPGEFCNPKWVNPVQPSNQQDQPQHSNLKEGR